MFTSDFCVASHSSRSNADRSHWDSRRGSVIDSFVWITMAKTFFVSEIYLSWGQDPGYRA